MERAYQENMNRRFFDIKFVLRAVVLIFFCQHAAGQKITVHGGFMMDSLGIGEQTKYYLTARYPSKLNVVFPDSTYHFTPFEFEKKSFFPTKTTDSVSYDSAVYYLTTFEVTNPQTLSLPVFVVSRKDSVPFYPEVDSIRLIELVAHVPDSLSADKLPLKMNTAYQRVPFLFNYPVLIIVSGAILVVAVVLLLVFGDRIRRYFKLKKLKKNHQRFLESYSAQLAKLNEKFSIGGAESVLITWKRYLEQLEQVPYTKLTTREILLTDKDENLDRDLHAIDRAIYGHEARVDAPLENLRSYAVGKYLRKLDEIQHG